MPDRGDGFSGESNRREENRTTQVRVWGLVPT